LTPTAARSSAKQTPGSNPAEPRQASAWSGWLRVLLLAVVLAAFATRLWELSRQDIWWDEARNLDVAMRPLGQIAIAPELDIQPPLYYYLLHGWMRISGLEIGSAPGQIAWWARWLSVAAGTLLPLLSARLAGFAMSPLRSRAAAIAAGSTAIVGLMLPFWLAESQETRMYTLALALLASAALALLHAELPTTPLAPRTRVRRLFAFTLLSAAALATHYNALFILVAWYAWWGVTCLLQDGRWQRMRAPLATGLGTIALLLPLAPIAARQIPTYANPNLTVPTVSAYINANLQGHLAGYAWDAARLGGWAEWWLWGALGMAAAGLALGALCLFRSATPGPQRGREAQTLIFLLVWLLGGLSLYYVAVLDRGAFNVRYSAFVTPALVALFGTGIAGWRRLWAPAMLIVAAGLPSFFYADIHDARYDREDITGVTQWLRENTQPDDLVLVDQKYPFGFYYQRFAIDTRFEPTGPEPAPARYLFVDINTLDQRLSDWAADANRVFWVQWFESDTDPRHAVPYLLGQSGAFGGEEFFQGWRISWWQMSPPNRFATAPSPGPLRVHIPPVETVEVSYPQAGSTQASVPVAIRWKLAGNAPASPFAARPLKARVALYDQADNRLIQADERLLNDRHVAPSEWSAVDQPLTVYLLTPSPDMPLAPGTYRLRLLVYDAETLEALTILDDAGNPAGIEAPLGVIELE